MARPQLKATHIGDGVWRFECPLHEKPFNVSQLSSPRAARGMMEQHADKDHPGVSVRIKVDSAYSGTKYYTYTAPANVNVAGDRL